MVGLFIGVAYLLIVNSRDAVLKNEPRLKRISKSPTQSASKSDPISSRKAKDETFSRKVKFDYNTMHTKDSYPESKPNDLPLKIPKTSVYIHCGTKKKTLNKMSSRNTNIGIKFDANNTWLLFGEIAKCFLPEGAVSIGQENAQRLKKIGRFGMWELYTSDLMVRSAWLFEDFFDNLNFKFPEISNFIATNPRPIGGLNLSMMIGNLFSAIQEAGDQDPIKHEILATIVIHDRDRLIKFLITSAKRIKEILIVHPNIKSELTDSVITGADFLYSLEKVCRHMMSDSVILMKPSIELIGRNKIAASIASQLLTEVM